MQSAENALALTSGQRLVCPLCDTEVIVIRAPSSNARIACGGTALVAFGAARAGAGHLDPAGAISALGKRYIEETSGLELLCTRPGAGALSCNDEILEVKAPRPLPSSD